MTMGGGRLNGDDMHGAKKHKDTKHSVNTCNIYSYMIAITKKKFDSEMNLLVK